MSLRVMNRFIQLETTPTGGGAVIRVAARGDFIFAPEVDHDSGEVIIHVHKDAGPRIGETLMVGKRHIVVAKRRYDSYGRLQVMDADTGAWYAVPDGKE